MAGSWLINTSGVGLTMPYKDCKATESSKWKDPIADNDDQATVEFKAAKAWSDACAAENKELGTLIGTAYVARDIMAIVEALEAAGEDGLIRYAGKKVYHTLSIPADLIQAIPMVPCWVLHLLRCFQTRSLASFWMATSIRLTTTVASMFIPYPSEVL